MSLRTAGRDVCLTSPAMLHCYLLDERCERHKVLWPTRGNQIEFADRGDPVRITKLVLLILVGILAWAIFPFVAPASYANLLVFTAILAIGGLGVGFLLGQAGIVNLAQATFYGIGAYATAYGTTVLQWPSFFSLLSGLLLSATAAAIVGYPILRLSGLFLALATLALMVIFNQCLLEWDWLTGGTLGIGAIPKIELLGYELDTPTRFYFFVWPLTILVFWLVSNLLKGRSGIAMRAMRDSPEAARVMAINAPSLRAKLFVLSSVLGALSGSLFAHYVGYVSAETFTVEKAMYFLLVPVVGGLRHPWGAIPGAAVVMIVPEILSPLGDVYRIVFGITLILIIMLFPEGIMGRLIRLVRA